MNQACVSLDEVFAAAGARAASLVPETSGYLTLAVADATSRLPYQHDDRAVLLTVDGGVMVPRKAALVPPGDAARGLRDVLRRLLAASTGSMPGLVSAARPRSEERDIDHVIADIEAALIPVNRAAAKRALARLARETLRAKQMGKLKKPSQPPAAAPAARAPAPAQIAAPAPAPAQIAAPPAAQAPAQVAAVLAAQAPVQVAAVLSAPAPVQVAAPAAAPMPAQVAAVLAAQAPAPVAAPTTAPAPAQVEAAPAAPAWMAAPAPIAPPVHAVAVAPVAPAPITAPAPVTVPCIPTTPVDVTGLTALAPSVAHAPAEPAAVRDLPVFPVFSVPAFAVAEGVAPAPVATFAPLPVAAPIHDEQPVAAPIHDEPPPVIALEPPEDVPFAPDPDATIADPDAMAVFEAHDETATIAGTLVAEIDGAPDALAADHEEDDDALTRPLELGIAAFAPLPAAASHAPLAFAATLPAPAPREAAPDAPLAFAPLPAPAPREAAPDAPAIAAATLPASAPRATAPDAPVITVALLPTETVRLETPTAATAQTALFSEPAATRADELLEAFRAEDQTDAIPAAARGLRRLADLDNTPPPGPPSRKAERLAAPISIRTEPAFDEDDDLDAPPSRPRSHARSRWPLALFVLGIFALLATWLYRPELAQSFLGLRHLLSPAPTDVAAELPQAPATPPPALDAAAAPARSAEASPPAAQAYTAAPPADGAAAVPAPSPGAAPHDRKAHAAAAPHRRRD